MPIQLRRLRRAPRSLMVAARFDGLTPIVRRFPLFQSLSFAFEFRFSWLAKFGEICEMEKASPNLPLQRSQSRSGSVCPSTKFKASIIWEIDHRNQSRSRPSKSRSKAPMQTRRRPTRRPQSKRLESRAGAAVVLSRGKSRGASMYR